MADWNKPSSTDAYNNVGGVLDSLAQKDLDAARAFDDASTAPTNTPTGAMRLSTNERKFKWWDGSAWIEKITEFAINIGGYAAKLQTARKINVTGALTSTGADFDGTAAINIDVTDVDLDKVGKAGTAAKANVGTGVGQLVPAERVIFGESGSATTNLDPGNVGVSPDAIVKSGAYRATLNFGNLYHSQDPLSPQQAFQFGIQDYYTNDFYARSKYGGAWMLKVKFWTTGNFNPSLKADAASLGTAAAANVSTVAPYEAPDGGLVKGGYAGIGYGLSVGTLNWSSPTGFNGFQYEGAPMGSGPPGASGSAYAINLHANGAPYSHQIGAGINEDALYFRNMNNGVWRNWRTIWHSGNYSPVYHGASITWATNSWYVVVGSNAAYEAPQNYVVSGISKGVSGNTNGDVIAGVYIRALQVA